MASEKEVLSFEIYLHIFPVSWRQTTTKIIFSVKSNKALNEAWNAFENIFTSVCWLYGISLRIFLVSNIEYP